MRPKARAIWAIRPLSRTYVRASIHDDDKVMITIQGVTCDVVGTLTRNDARLLAKRINQCLDDTRKS